jgi:hypothetical protein
MHAVVYLATFSHITDMHAEEGMLIWPTQV